MLYESNIEERPLLQNDLDLNPYKNLTKKNTKVYEYVEPPCEDPGTRFFSWRVLWAYTGPGWLMSIAYLDPGNLESDLQAGAYSGYQLIYMLLTATMMGLFLQILAVRLGVVTGHNLAEICMHIYPRWASRVLWVMTEIAIIGSDIQEVLGSAIALQVLFRLPLWIGCLITALDTFTFLLLHRYGIRKLEALFITLIGIMLLCFCENFYLMRVEAADVLGGFVPRLPSYATTQAVGLLGAVIMPHNIFLHSALVQSRRLDRDHVHELKLAMKYFSIEASMAILLSFCINLTVLGVFAKGFFSPDCIHSFPEHGANSACVSEMIGQGISYGPCTTSDGVRGYCQPIGLLKAGHILHGMLGEYAQTIWAIGLLAAGQSSTMTGTYAGQFVMEGFLQIRLEPWKRVALTRSVALLPALAVSLLCQTRPESGDTVGELLNVLQSIQLPFALLPLLVFTGSQQLMGTKFVNNWGMKAAGWSMGLLVCAINIYLVFTKAAELQFNLAALIGITCAGSLYFIFLAYLSRLELKSLYLCCKALVLCNR